MDVPVLINEKAPPEPPLAWGLLTVTEVVDDITPLVPATKIAPPLEAAVGLLMVTDSRVKVDVADVLFI